MKTILRFFFVATMSVFFFSQSFSQTTAKSGSDKAVTETPVQGKFIDKNNDGVCDNHDAKGITNNCASFVDKDGNGVCDNCAGTGNGGKNANCQGMGNQNHQGCGHGNANCCGRGSNQGGGQGKCCPAKQGSSNITPSETPDPKK